MSEKKKKQIWLTIWIVLGTLLLCSLVVWKFVDWVKFVVGASCCLLAVALIVKQNESLKEFKKSIESEMPVFFAGLYNAGVITKEQCLNPGEQEKTLFLNEYVKDIRKRIVYMVITGIIGAYLLILLITI